MGTPMGHLLIDTSLATHDKQLNDVALLVSKNLGWYHPDGVRLVVAVEWPTAARDKMIASGWPANAITIAR